MKLIKKYNCWYCILILIFFSSSLICFIIDNKQPYGLTTDIWRHTIISRDIQKNGELSIIEPWTLDIKNIYPLGFHVFQVVLSNISNINIDLVALYNNVILVPLFAILFFILCMTLFKTKYLAIFVIFLLLFTGSIGWIKGVENKLSFDLDSIDMVKANNESGQTLFNDLSRKMLFSITTILGLLLFTLFIYLLNKNSIFLSSLVLVSMFLTHITEVLFVSLFFIIFILLSNKIKKELILLPLLICLLFLINIFTWSSFGGFIGEMKFFILISWFFSISIIFLKQNKILNEKIQKITEYSLIFFIIIGYLFGVFGQTNQIEIYFFPQGIIWLFGPFLLSLLMFRQIRKNKIFYSILLSSLFIITISIIFPFFIGAERVLIYLKLVLVPYFVLFLFHLIKTVPWKKYIIFISILLIILLPFFGYLAIINYYYSNSMSEIRIQRFLNISKFINENIPDNKNIILEPDIHYNSSYGIAIPYLTNNKITPDYNYGLDYIKNKLNKTDFSRSDIENLWRNESVTMDKKAYFLFYNTSIVKPLLKEYNLDYILTNYRRDVINTSFKKVYEDKNFALFCISC